LRLAVARSVGRPIGRLRRGALIAATRVTCSWLSAVRVPRPSWPSWSSWPGIGPG